MADETKNKIMQATLKLVIDRGYTLTTTKDIAKCAGVSEVTIFRKFESKQNIIKCIFEKMQEIPELNMNILDKCTWSLYDDLKMFSTLYFKYVTPDYVKLIIGTRSPEVFPLIKQYIMEIPSTFKKIIMKYFEIMYDKGKISNNNFESRKGYGKDPGIRRDVS